MFLYIVSVIHRLSTIYHIGRFIIRQIQFSERQTYSRNSIIMNPPSEENTPLNNAAMDSDTETETETDYESEYESDDEEYYDIEVAETDFENEEKHDGHYYLGTPWTGSHFMLMNGTISVATFLDYEYSRILGYLRTYSVFQVSPRSQIEIMKLIVDADQAYTTVIKTHWLRLVQRRWKAIYRERERILARRMSIQNQMYFRIHGRYLEGTRGLPCLRGMLSGLFQGKQI